MTLNIELATFDRDQPRLLGQEGRFALIHGNAVIGVYDTYGDAIGAGYAVCGLAPFLVKQIEVFESVRLFTRDLKCPRSEAACSPVPAPGTPGEG